jgi:hypothetical protein
MDGERNLRFIVADVFMMEWLTQLLLVLPLMKFSNTLPDVIRIGEFFQRKQYKPDL